MVTGDDTPAGGGNSGGFGPFNGMLTNESQTVAVAGATGGTFTLTFDGQTTAPIAFPLDNAAIEAALEALSNLDDVAVTGTGDADGQLPRQQVRAERSADDRRRLGPDRDGHADGRAWRRSTTARTSTSRPTAGSSTGRTSTRDGARRTRTTSAASCCGSRSRPATSPPAEKNAFGGAYTVPAGNLYPVGTARTRPEVYAMGFRNPFRVTLDKVNVAYVSDYSPDSHVPQQFRGPAGTGRFEIVDKPANYGWPLCYKTDLPYYKWDFNTSTPLPSLAAPEVNECNNPTRGPQNTSRWVTSGGPTVDPGLEFGPPITNPEIWYSYRDNMAAPNGPQGTQCFGELRARRARANPVGGVPAALPRAVHGRRRPARHRAVQLRPDEPEPDQVPALLGRGVDRRASSRRTRCARSGMDSNGNDPQDQQHVAVRPGPGHADAAVALRQPDGHGVRA